MTTDNKSPQYLTRLSRDDAETILWQSIEAAGKVGNKTDDKLILAELCKRSIVLCHVDNEGMRATIAAEQQTAELKSEVTQWRRGEVERVKALQEQDALIERLRAQIRAMALDAASFGIVPKWSADGVTITPSVDVMRRDKGKTIEDVAAGVWVEDVDKPK